MEMDNYNRGLRGFQRDIHQDYHEYAKGRNIRELTQGPDIAPSGGVGCVGVIAILITFLPLIIISAVTSLFLALLLKVYLRTIEIEHKILSFKAAFKILFKISVIYQIIFALAYLGVIMSFKLFPTSIEINANNIQLIYRIILGLYVAIQIPAILITANFLRKKLNFFEKFRGFSGYLRSVVFIAFAMAIIPSLFMFVIMYGIYTYLLPQIKFLV